MLYFVVEGKKDSAKLKSIFPKCTTIETNGSAISKQTINLIKKVSINNNVIVFTDPDLPGKKIRQIILKEVPSLKHAFINRKDAIKNNKLGVAETSRENIVKAIDSLVEFKNINNFSTSWKKYFSLGYVGKTDSSLKRKRLCKKLNIPYANSKTLFKWINMIGYKL